MSSVTVVAGPRSAPTGQSGRMTSPSLANPRRSTLSSLAKGSDLATCSVEGCHNVAVLVQAGDGGRTLVCRTHAR